MAYEFKGWDWSELAECWDIKVEKQDFMVGIAGSDEKKSLGKFPEKITLTRHINNTVMTFETEDEEEVLAEKVKRHIWDNMNHTDGEFKDKKVQEDIIRFLNKLADADEGIGYNPPVIRAIASLENGFTLAKWVTRNLEDLWS